MEIRRLEYFLDLVETGNYSETAERMFTSQSSVSKQIQALEKELGCMLFDRSHRKISLTDEGRIVQEYALQIVRTRKEMEKKLGDFAVSSHQVIVIQAIPVMEKYRMNELIQGFKQQYPRSSVRISETERTYLEKNLQEELCDLIFTRIFEDSIPELEVLVMDRDQFVAVVPEDHELCSQQEIGLEQLQQESFLLLDEKTHLLDSVRRMCRQAGFEPDVEYTGVRIDTILRMIGNGMGVSVLMDKTVTEEERYRIKKIPLRSSKESRLVFARKKKKERSRGERLFWNYIKENYSISE